MKTCSVEGCSRKFYAKEKCRLCYARVYDKNPRRKAQKREVGKKYRSGALGQLKELRSRLRKKGFTIATYEAALLSQAGCAICGATFEKYKPQCDHDHATGRGRALLCNPCNVALGMYEKHQRANGFRISQYESYLERFV